MTRAEVEQAFRERFGAEPEAVVRAPGRVNLLGAHVDYSDGFVLPAAIDRSIWLAARRAVDGPGRLVALELDAEASLLSAADDPAASAQPDWSYYPRGVLWALRKAGHPAPAIDAVYGGDLPRGAGVSSSAAVEMAFSLAFESLGGFELDGRERALLGRRVENEVLGVQSGVMDQFASIHGRDGHAILLDCRSLEHELIPMPAGAAVVVADCGVRRTLVGSGFNDRRAECEQALTLLQEEVPEIVALRDVTAEQLFRFGHRLSAVLVRRVRHVVEECSRVLAGAEALRRGDLGALGVAMRDSHRSSRDLYEVSIPELDHLAETAWGVEGCYGARLAGGGFGGCVTALVAEPAAGDLEARWRRSFEQAFGRRPGMFRCRVSAGAEVVVGP